MAQQKSEDRRDVRKPRREPAAAIAVQLVIILLVAAGVAWGLSQGGLRVEGGPFDGTPVVWVCWILAFGVQWCAFVPAYLRQTERYYDLVGSVTYLSVTGLALALSGRRDLWSLLVAGLVGVWAVRLGTFLFRRVHRDGGDGRFDQIKTYSWSFLRAWTLQGLWVFLTLAAVLAILTSAEEPQLGFFGWIGVGVWLVGWVFEVVADQQKSRFRMVAGNRERFISVGLWSWSRHPNYFGEIVLWLGMAIAATPTLEGGRWVAWISPLFVYVLLTRISGVPLLERRADKKWGGEADYEAYKKRTSLLLPTPPG